MEKVSSHLLDPFTGFGFHSHYRSSGWRWQLHESLGWDAHLQGNDRVSSWAEGERKHFWEFLQIWSSKSSKESAINLMNKGCISLRKGGDNVLASSSKRFPFQPDTLQSCLDSAWADCPSSRLFLVGILTWCKWWWTHCLTAGIQEDKEDKVSLGGHTS